MDFSSDNTTPWELISAAIQGHLSPEEEVAFRQWMAASAQNEQLFMQLKALWDSGLDDYQAYRQADETSGWNALRNKLHEREASVADQQSTPMIRKRPVRLIRIISIAATLVIVSGIVIWYMMINNSSSNYQTGNAEQRSVFLPDGTVIKLSPATSIEVPAGYNESVRKVILTKGEAFFEVQHQEAIPFIVELGTASIKDAGTGFRVQKTNDSITVSVVTGKVEFRNHADNQVRLLSAGMLLQLFPGSVNVPPRLLVDSGTRSGNRLHFVNAPLPEVINRFKEVYNKQIILIDTVLQQKRFTGHLEGQSFEAAMDVLCRSLNITFVQENEAYYLKKE